jgi:molybdenum cofactor guanylyltransferase
VGLGDDLTAAILVGGQARRLGGRNKPRLRIGDRSIVSRQLAVITAVGIRDVLLVGRWDEDPVAHTRHVPDLVEGCGALGGLYSALLVAPAPVVLVLAGDLPFVSPALLHRLIAIAPGEDAIVPRTSAGWHPLCAAYRRTVAPGIKARLDQGALRITDALGGMRVRELTDEELLELDPRGMVLMNVNTPDDLRLAEHRARPVPDADSHLR